MEIIKLGEVEAEILTYLCKNRGVNAQAIAQALGKKHTAYVTDSIYTLLEKNLIEKTGEYQPSRGRPAALYGLSANGVRYAILSGKCELKQVLELYKDSDEVVEWLNTIYLAFEAAEYTDRDAFLKELCTIILSLVDNVTTDFDDLLVMGGAWMARRLRKMPKSQRLKLATIANQSSLPSYKRAERIVRRRLKNAKEE